MPLLNFLSSFFSLLWPRAFCRECLWKYSRRSHFHGSLCSSQFVVASTILPGMYIKGAGYFLGRFSYRPSWHLTIGSRYYRCLKWNLSPKRKRGNHYLFHGPVFFASFIICMAWFTISFLEEEKISRKKGAFSPSSVDARVPARWGQLRCNKLGKLHHRTG